MQKAYIDAVYDLAEQDKNVVLLTADNGTDFDRWFKADFKERYFDMGISECNMVGVAAGMASCGLKPFVQTGGSFLAYRAYEFIRNDVCLQRQNVKIIGTGSGLSISNLGATHHTTEDISVLRALPGITILSPATSKEVEKCIHAAYEIEGPVYIRLGMGSEVEISGLEDTWSVDKMDVIIEGENAVLFSTGSILAEVLKRKEWFEENSVKVVNVHTLKPFNQDEVLKYIGNCKSVFSLEEHNIIGGLGSMIAEVLAEYRVPVSLTRIGIGDKFAKGYGTYEDIRRTNGIDTDSICKTLENELHR